MVSALLVFAVALLMLALAWSLLRSGHPSIRDARDWERERHYVDAEMFRILLDPSEQRFLRKFLPKAQFRIYIRKRIHLTLGLLDLVERNAGMLIRLGQLAREKHDSRLTQQAEDLITSAIQFRLNLLLARPCLYLQWIFPSLVLLQAAREMRYEHLLKAVARLQQRGLQIWSRA